jgi:hypothetical protein
LRTQKGKSRLVSCTMPFPAMVTRSKYLQQGGQEGWRGRVRWREGKGGPGGCQVCGVLFFKCTRGLPDRRKP